MLWSLTQDQRAYPARVICFDPGGVRGWSGKLPISSNIQLSRRQRFDAPPLRDMKIGILVPADHVKEEIAGPTFRFGRELLGRKRQRQFVAAIEKHQSIIPFSDQFVY